MLVFCLLILALVNNVVGAIRQIVPPQMNYFPWGVASIYTSLTGQRRPLMKWPHLFLTCSLIKSIENFSAMDSG